MTRKKVAMALISLLCGCNMLLADNQKGIDFYRGNMLETAKIYFNGQLPDLSGRDLAEAYYFLGNIYFDQQKPDSAAYYFDKSVETDPEYPFGYVGQGKSALFNKNTKGADDLFSKAAKMEKKNSDIRVDAALAYAKNKMYEEAKGEIEKARKINKNNPRIYVAEGDILLMQNPTNAGDAAAKYDNAIYFDKTCKEAYIKGSRVYRTINIDVALEKITTVLAMDPDYIPAYLELGETYYANGLYTKSAEAYKRYMEAPGVPEEYQDKYASALFVAKDFQGVLNQANQTLAKNPKNTHMLRIKMFAEYESGDYTTALATAKTYFATVKPSEIAWQDYRYYAMILKENKQSEAAIDALNNALKTVTDQPELYKELASAYADKEDYKNAIPNYQKYFETSQEYSLSDLLSYGQAYYYYARNLSEAPEYDAERKANFEKSDSLFNEITVKAPQLFQGYWWRARVHAALDPDSKLGLAKPYYEKTLEVMEASGNAPKSIQVEAYNYLAFYYYVQYEDAFNRKNTSEANSNKELSIKNWEKVLELQPENEAAADALKILKK